MIKLIFSAASLTLFFMVSFSWQVSSQTGIHHGDMQLGVPAALAGFDKDKSKDKDKNKNKEDHSKYDHHDRTLSPAAFRSIHGS